ncbi:hypothetical protein DPMN_192909 [Dreissena polymorpha]|uniref:Uncharacterized protein n=1 Tax=Dreissena polymorpha TaxID=45954 RepID=A0A9D4B4W9_DREPO|nr:hypothetical protein DPMN_192909 [Dreissena polymorpha]
MTVPLTSEAATLTSSLTSMTLLGRPATRHVCRAHRDPPNDSWSRRYRDVIWTCR